MDWRSLTFFHPDLTVHSERNKPSILQHGGDHSQLHIQRDDQLWVHALLPTMFHATDTSQNPRRGGLAGELCLILGLIGLSASYQGDAVERAFVDCMGSGKWPWVLPNTANRAGWEISRGVVVHVYGIDGWDDEYENFEQGKLGKFFA